MISLISPFLNHSQSRPDAPALIDRGGHVITYGELYVRACRQQKLLRRNGVRQGSKVLVAVPMSPDLYACLIALLGLGAVSIFLDPWLGGRTMNRIIRKVQPDVLLATPKLRMLSMLMPASHNIPHRISPAIGHDTTTDLTDSVPDEEDTALVTFTGGTSTGKPAGIRRTYGILNAQLNSLQYLLKTGQHIRSFTHYPVFGLLDLALGNTLIIPDFNLLKLHKVGAQQLVEQLATSRADRLICSPLLLRKVMEHTDKTRINLSITSIFCGGARVSRLLARNTLQTFGPVAATAIYGSSEAEPIAHTSFETLAGSDHDPLEGVLCGSPVDEVNLRTLPVGENPEALRNAAGNSSRPGEIIVSGDHVARDYYMDEEDRFSHSKIKDENGTIWHRTGDVGTLKNNIIYLMGRREGIITYKNEKFYPYPVEEYFEVHYLYTDLAYLQDTEGRCCFCLGSGIKGDNSEIRKSFRKIGYPLDRIHLFRKPLPRDARHRSKLLETELRKWI
ncbi:MAG: hypothetical protein EA364_08365 [Balneolaceae bacterium]|nr:MAG: hypothetical protein EA364_08365 [Balneolaceae bacterium]